jgi:hypothetical protein
VNSFRTQRSMDHSSPGETEKISVHLYRRTSLLSSLLLILIKMGFETNFAGTPVAGSWIRRSQDLDELALEAFWIWTSHRDGIPERIRMNKPSSPTPGVSWN